MEKKTLTVHVRLDEDTAKVLKAMADADDRKLSAFIARVLKQYVAEQRRKGDS
jgi:predicted transcriptional regulator